MHRHLGEGPGKCTSTDTQLFRVTATLFRNNDGLYVAEIVGESRETLTTWMD